VLILNYTFNLIGSNVIYLNHTKFSITIIIFLFLACFAASAVDSIAGGGGLISLPAFILGGLPSRIALGTNKFSSTSGAIISGFQYFKNGKVNFKLLKYLIPFSFIGSALGVYTVLNIDENLIRALVLILILFVGIYSLFSKKLGMEDNFKGINTKNVLLGILLAFCLGFYDGFFGPGTGSFLIFGLIKIYGFNYINASGNSKILNLTSNISALLIFALHSQIYFYLGLITASAMIIGANLGTKIALKKGSKLIKPIFICMSLGVAIKMIYSLIIQ